MGVPCQTLRGKKVFSPCFFYRLDLYHKLPDSCKRQYTSWARKRRFEPPTMAGGSVQENNRNGAFANRPLESFTLNPDRTPEL